MFNLNFAFLQRDSSQNITINPKIDVSIRRIEKDFFDGNFRQAVEDLNDLIKDNSSEALKSVKYQLLLLKASFLMQFRKIDEFEELIELIENKYSNELKSDNGTKFEELKLTLMAFNKDEEFFEFSKQIRRDTPNSKPQGHFDIIFYLNSGNFQEAKEIFDIEIKNEKYKKHLLMIGGHIYSSLYRDKTDDVDIFNNADKYYTEALKTENINFLDKLQIQGFYAITLLNKNFQDKVFQNDLPFSIEDYKKSLDIVLENEVYFNPEYIKILIENYIYVLFYLRLKDEYNQFYKKYEQNLSIKHYIQYCDVNNIEYKHEKIQKSILTNNRLDDLLIYSSLIPDSTDKDIIEIIRFLKKKNELLYRHSSMLYSYIKGQILLSNEIETDLIKYLEERKHNDIDTLLAFIETEKYLSMDIQDNDINKLIEFAEFENNLQQKILDVIKLLSRLGKRKEYLDLALAKQNVFNSVILETLKICDMDKDLHFKDFENFINGISNKDYYGTIIGNIYIKHDKHKKAFAYYYQEYKKNNRVDIMLAMLQVAGNYYHSSHQILEDSKQREIFNALIAKQEDLNIENLIFLLQYSIYILKDTRQILPIVNQELLNLDIKNLDNSIQVMLSNIFMQTSFGVLSNYNDMFLYDANLCLVQDGKTYFQNNYTTLEENKNNFGLYVIDDNEYFLKKQDNTCKKESLFHRLVGPFAFRCENPNMIEMKLDEDSEDPLHELFDFMNQHTNHTKDLFQRYSDEIYIGLYALASKTYKNYFTLIPYLLNSKTINFNSLHINYLPKERKKILTLSSIIFLSEINQLEFVLERDDIVIQQTLVNWLKDYSQTIDYTNMPQDFTYLDEEGHKFILFTDDNIKQAENFKASIFKIINKILKCEIIDDTSENLPIKGTYSMLAPLIGNQEYRALAYCINHDFQIISENNILKWYLM